MRQPGFTIDVWAPTAREAFVKLVQMMFSDLDPDRHDLAQDISNRGFRKALRPASLSEVDFIEVRRRDADCYDPVQYLYLGEVREVVLSTGAKEVQMHFVFFGTFCGELPGPVNGLI